MASTEHTSIHGEWSSSLTFILAATGAAVGLGNIWKFPYITGEHGGGAFVLLYLICVIVIGIPLLMAEILIGRYGRQNPAATLSTAAKESGHSKMWAIVGFVGILAGFLIMSYYSVVAGWTVDYIFQAAMGDFYHQSAPQIAVLFKNLVSSPWKLLFWNTLVVAATVFVLARGVRKGIEKAVVFLFPAMVILILLILGYSISTGYFMQGVHFLFYPDFAKLDASSTMVALGHAFFTLSLATGSIMMYGAYLPKHASVTKSSIVIAAADTGIALLAGLATFPIVFANHLTPGAGPGLIFQTLPIAFGKMPYGSLFAALFFVMLFFAAFTSAISLLEPTVAWLMETFQFNRISAALTAGLGIWILGFGTIFSFNLWANVKFFGLNFFDSLDYLTANFMLPLGGLLIAIFAAWFLDKTIAKTQLSADRRWLFLIWRFILRYISPLVIILLFLYFIGIININGG